VGDEAKSAIWTLREEGRSFTDIAKPMFDRINRNTEQSRTLATLRDTLLPKLLSGELSVAALDESVSLV
jgi:type I restriction enzyme S subunit